MNPLSEILTQWQTHEIISTAKAAPIKQAENMRPVSLSSLLRNLLYLGLILFTSGAGMLVYLHIDTIGHDALIVALALLTLVCFYYTYRHSSPFSLSEVNSEGKFVDFVLLLGALLFLLLEGYAQWRYSFFGTRYGLAAFVPAVVFLFFAYRFDHRGVLSMGLTALASWVGLSITPLEVLTGNDFGNFQIINTAIGFGGVVGTMGVGLAKGGIKVHFTDTYLLLTGNVLFVGALAGLFTTDYWFLYALLIAAGCGYFGWYARQKHSFIFLLMAVMYGYIAFTYLLFSEIDNADFWVAFGGFYFLASAGGIVFFILNYKKWLTH